MPDDKCPVCGGELERDAVDIGVGTQYGPAGCRDCGWVEPSDAGLVPGVDVDIDDQPWSDEGARKMSDQRSRKDGR